MEFPKTVAAVEKAETTDQWAIGAALLAEIGKRPAQSANDGSYKKFERCAKELAAKGFDYKAATLRDHRDVAQVFPPSVRAEGVSYRVHRVAGSTEMLVRIQKAAGKKPLTDRFAQALKKGILAADQAKREEARAEARAKAEAERKEAEKARAKVKAEKDAKAKAKAEAEAEKAEAKADEAEKEAEGPPAHKEPTQKEIDLRVVKADILGLAVQGRKAAREAHKLFEKYGEQFTDAEVRIIREGFLETANEWSVESAKPRSMSRLSLVANE